MQHDGACPLHLVRDCGIKTAESDGVRRNSPM
jgi:hypothetical protein